MSTVDVAEDKVEKAARVVQAIKDLRPFLEANAPEGDKNRRSSQESVEALRDAGAFKIAVPGRFGGYETSIRNQLEVSAAVGQADGGLAWVTTLINVGAWLVGMQNEQLQSDIFGDDLNARNVGVIAPSVTGRPVKGGYIVNGKGFYASGSLHATWGGNGAMLLDEDGNEAEQVMVFAPMSDLSVEDTWYVTGMRGSGSNCIIWDEVFVPNHRIFYTERIESEGLPTPFKEESLYRAPFSSVLALVLVGPQLGIGRAALEYVQEQAHKKTIAYTTLGKQENSVAFQVRIGKAAALIDIAETIAYDAADRLDRWAEVGYTPTKNERAQIRAVTASVVENITDALNSLLFAHGSAGFAEKSPLQRYWRDSNVGARHAFVLPDVSFESYGKTLLNIEEQIAPVL